MQRKARTKNPTKVKKKCHVRPNDHFEISNGIKLLSGYTLDEYKEHEEIKKFYYNLVPHRFFEKLVLSTIAGIGLLHGVNMHEDFVLKDPIFINGVTSVIVKDKKYTRSGVEIIEGKAFRCQFTVNLQINPSNNKQYKIKVFRNGKIHIPGILKDDMGDILKPLEILCRFLETNLGVAEISPESVKATMRNYGCDPSDDNLGIIIGNFKKCMVNEHKLPIIPIKLLSECQEILVEHIGDYGFFIFMKYVGWSGIPIQSPKRNEQKTSGILIKLNRYPEPDHKDLTIRVLTSGKITFNGGNSHIEVESAYYWLNFIFAKYYEDTIFDPKRNFPVIPENLEDIIFDDGQGIDAESQY